MDFNEFSSKLGYPAIFSESPEAASANLFRLITKKQCGYNEGAEKWHTEISRVLDEENDLTKMSELGSRLTEKEWRQTLRTLRDDLASFRKRTFIAKVLDRIAIIGRR